MKKWYEVKASAEAGEDAVIDIYDGIGMFGVTAKDFNRDMKAVLAKDAPVAVHINSPGGDVFDGLAIYNMLKEHQGQVTVHIDGLAASIATVVAMAGDEIIIPENAMMMIHNPMSGAFGDAQKLSQVIDVLDKIKASMVGIYSARTGRSAEDVRADMDAETWLTGAEAVALGYADATSAPVRLAASYNIRAYQHIPDSVCSRFCVRKNDEGRAIISALSSFNSQIKSIQF